MPEEAAAEIVKFVGRAAFELSSDLIFSKHGARYFHGIGRHVIALVTFGRVRIELSLRQVPKGTAAKPLRRDWAALFVGIAVFLASGAAVLVSAFG